MTGKPRLRLYLDTSVFGGCYDDEFMLPSRRLFAAIRQGKYVLLLSEIVLEELAGAPAAVRRLVVNIPPRNLEFVPTDERVVLLGNKYLAAAILTKKSRGDLLHVACAAVAAADAIVSWNFRHIVRLDKMREYNRINVANGYAPLTIITPGEVFTNEKGN